MQHVSHGIIQVIVPVIHVEISRKHEGRFATQFLLLHICYLSERNILNHGRRYNARSSCLPDLGACGSRVYEETWFHHFVCVLILHGCVRALAIGVANNLTPKNKTMLRDRAMLREQRCYARIFPLTKAIWNGTCYAVTCHFSWEQV